MDNNILSEATGRGTLESKKLDLQIEGTWSMQYLLELRCAPRFKFHFSAGISTKIKLFEQAHMTLDFSMINGETDDGRNLQLGEIIVENVDIHAEDESTIEFKARNVTLGAEETVDEVRFLIPNLEFLGTEVSTYEDDRIKRTRLDKCTINLECYEVELRWLPNYEQIISNLRQSNRKIAITAIATIKKVPSESRLVTKKVIDLMYVINQLVNLGMGRFVYWPKCDGYLEGKLVWEKLRGDILLSSFGPRLGFLDFRKEPRALSEFISSSFTNFKKWVTEDRRTAEAILHSYIWGLNLPLLETRIFSLAFALEGLISVFLTRQDQSYFKKIESDRARIKLREFAEKQLVPEIEDGEKAEEFRGKLEGKIQGFIRRPLKDRIKTILDQCENISYEYKWLRDFVDARNDVVHHIGKMNAKDLSSAWLKGLELFELILLGKRLCSTKYHRSKVAEFAI